MVVGKNGRDRRPGRRCAREGPSCARPGAGAPSRHRRRWRALEAALRRERIGYAVRDYGSCSRRSTRSSGQLFVNRIAGERNSGQDGWVYKVNDRAPGDGRGGRARCGRGDRAAVVLLRAGRGERRMPAFTAVSSRHKKSGLAGASLRRARVRLRRQARTAAGARARASRSRTETTSRLRASAPPTGSAVLTLPAPGPVRARARRPTGWCPSFPVTIRTGEACARAGLDHRCAARPRWARRARRLQRGAGRLRFRGRDAHRHARLRRAGAAREAQPRRSRRRDGDALPPALRGGRDPLRRPVRRTRSRECAPAATGASGGTGSTT